MKKAVLFVVVCLAPTLGQARIITVDDDAPADFNNIQAAIDDANNRDTVEIQPGTYTGPGNRDIDFLGKAITVRSTDPSNPNIVATTIIDCQNLGRGFYFRTTEDINSILDGLTITNGYASNGGAVYSDSGTLAIRNCSITNNASSNHGGGIYGVGGDITRCDISYNRAKEDGGGLYDCHGVIRECTIANNSAQNGAGLRHCNANILNCSIVGNSASGWAGGLYNCNGTIQDCTISYNSADFVGGLHYCNGPINSCTISHNSTVDAADRYGGGLANCDGPITDCSITWNTAGCSGGGLYYCHGTIANCIIAGNSAEYGGGIYNWYARGSVINCTISDNAAELFGGGLRYCHGTIANCIITGNSARYGGGLESCKAEISYCIIANNSASSSAGGGGGLSGCPGTISNCAILHNSARDDGGGLEKCIGPITNCTIAFNLAGDKGGGLISCGALTNCIVYNNTAGSGYNGLYSCASVTYSCVQDGSLGPGCINSDPILAADGFHLEQGSPCINAGDHERDYSRQNDIDGEPRVMGTGVDMGADEFTYEWARPVGLEIIGPQEVRAGYSAQYYAVATYADDSSRYVTLSATLSVNPETNGSIDNTGLLTTAILDIPQDITIFAQYREGEITLETHRVVHLYTVPKLFQVPDAYETIQEAIDAASNGDEVTVADGLYRGKGNRDIDFKGKAITVRSENGPESCIIDCNGVSRDGHCGFYFHSAEGADSLVDGFTITNGYGYALPGGGIDCANSSPTIRNCIITGNANTYTNYGGAGIACRNSAATIVDCTITHNTTPENGGGIYCKDSNLRIDGCTISHNLSLGRKADSGGAGIYSMASDVILTNTAISGNSTDKNGGAIHIRGRSLTAVGCTITGNTATDGAGIYYGISSGVGVHLAIHNCALTENSANGNGGGICWRYGIADITHSLIAGNAAAIRGAGIYNAAPVTLTSCTVTANSAASQGGGVFTEKLLLTSTNSIYWANTDGEGSGQFAQIRGEPAAISFTCVQDDDPNDANVPFGGDENSNIDDDPSFVDPNKGDYHLKSQAGRYDPNTQTWVIDDVTSACIDAGDPMTPIMYEPFPNGGIVNMGAYGGTTEASKSYFGEPLCEIIVAGDINGDCEVNFLDFHLMALHWMEEH